MTNNFLILLRKWSRFLHRDLSFFFSGVILIYAISGFMLNHKKDFNSDYDINRYEYKVDASFPMTDEQVTDEWAMSLLKQWDEVENYTQYYFPEEGQMKIFIKGGSSLVMDMNTGDAVYESVKIRPVLSALNRLHYNPTRWWTWFSDAFIVCLVIITITGLIMIKGNKGLWGRGGILLLIGAAIPLLFIFL